MPKKVKPDPHAIVHVDEWAPGRKRLWCACDASFRNGVDLTAEDFHRIHVESLEKKGVCDA